MTKRVQNQIQLLQKSTWEEHANCEISDSDITFFIGVYQDSKLFEDCLIELRKHYPTAPLAVRTDGDPDTTLRDITEKYNGDFLLGERRYPVEHRALMTQEMLLQAIEFDTRYLVKIDTDARVERRFKGLPQLESCLFGTLQSSGIPGQFSIQGGITGFTKQAARIILDSGFLHSPLLDNPEATWARAPILKERVNKYGLMSFDWILGWVAEELSIPLIDWPEIGSNWQEAPDNSDGTFAITHPHK